MTAAEYFRLIAPIGLNNDNAALNYQQIPESQIWESGVSELQLHQLQSLTEAATDTWYITGCKLKL